LETSARLVIAGGSSFTDNYVQRLEALAADDPRVIMAGPVYGEMRDELYSNAAGFILPSRLEGLPLTLLEAAAYRIPLVASDIAPNVEILGEGGPGAHLFRGGDVEQLRAALRTVLADVDHERAGAAVRGDRLVAEYRWDAVTDETERVYEQVLSRRSLASRPA